MKAFKHMTAFVLALVMAAALAVTAYAASVTVKYRVYVYSDEITFRQYDYSQSTTPSITNLTISATSGLGSGSALYGHENVRRHSMGETNITINFDAAKLDALEFVLRKQRSSVQRRMVEMLQQLYESEVPEAVREYVDSKATPVARPKRPVRAAKAANEQAAAMQQEE